MGFSVAGAAVVIAAAVVFAGAAFSRAAFQSLEFVDEGQRTAWERAARITHTTMDITEVKLVGLLIFQRLYVIADNKGSATINASQADVLLDGVWKTNIVLNHSVGTQNSSVWAPGTRLYVRLDTQTVPTRAMIVAPNGVTDTWGG